jgi:prepilin-type N-terminal cleavage/methylation domain-containing protein
MQLSKNRKGLTLIELLVVVLILAALVYIAVPRISQNSTTAKLRACQTNRATINTQIELYYSENGSYPTLATFLTDANYFPDGISCPSSGTYTYDANYHVQCDATGH